MVSRSELDAARDAAVLCVSAAKNVNGRIRGIKGGDVDVNSLWKLCRPSLDDAVEAFRRAWIPDVRDHVVLSILDHGRFWVHPGFPERLTAHEAVADLCMAMRAAVGYAVQEVEAIYRGERGDIKHSLFHFGGELPDCCGSDTEVLREWAAAVRMLGPSPATVEPTLVALEANPCRDPAVAVNAAIGAESAESDKKVSRQTPKNPDVRDLCDKLRSERPKGRTNIEIAREFCEGTGLDPASMLRQCRDRRFRWLWKDSAES